jgi:hypothetical protein
MSAQAEEHKAGHLLGFALIAILLSLLTAAWVSGLSPEKPTPPGMGTLFMGLFLIALGLTFLASYSYSSKSFFLRWLLKLCMGFPFMSDYRKVAILLSVICILTGVLTLGDGLGIRFP